jgi:hypothetical protein
MDQGAMGRSGTHRLQGGGFGRRRQKRRALHDLRCDDRLAHPERALRRTPHGDNSIFSLNEIDHFGDDGIDYAANNITITHNTIHDNFDIGDGNHEDAMQGQNGPLLRGIPYNAFSNPDRQQPGDPTDRSQARVCDLPARHRRL